MDAITSQRTMVKIQHLVQRTFLTESDYLFLIWAELGLGFPYPPGGLSREDQGPGPQDFTLITLAFPRIILPSPPPPGDIGPCLETFGAVTTGGPGVLPAPGG